MDNNTVHEEHEIAMFTSPKTVKKKRAAEIVAAQTVFCVVIGVLLLLLKIFIPEAFENINALIENYIL